MARTRPAGRRRLKTAALFLLAVLSAAPARARPPEAGVYPLDQWSDEVLSDIPEDLPKTSIILHHTAALVKDSDKRLAGQASWDAAVAHARGAQRLHKNIRGWKEIGYHYIIDWEGRIFEGRPVDRLGAHVEKHNTGSIGVVLLGDLTRQRLTRKQSDSLRLLLNTLMTRFHIDPKDISGHYQMKYTVCPGTYLNNIWDKDASPIDFIQMKPRPGLKTQRP